MGPVVLLLHASKFSRTTEMLNFYCVCPERYVGPWAAAVHKWKMSCLGIQAQ